MIGALRKVRHLRSFSKDELFAELGSDMKKFFNLTFISEIELHRFLGQVEVEVALENLMCHYEKQKF